MSKLMPVPGSTVRAITSIGTGVPRAVFATVLSVSPILPENLGTDGEPTISLFFLDPTDFSPAALGKVDWHGELDRHVNVHHASHPEVVNKLVSLCWVDVLPAPEDGAFLPRLWNNDPDGRISGSPMLLAQKYDDRPDGVEPAAPGGLVSVRRVVVEGLPRPLQPNETLDVNGEGKDAIELIPGDVLDYFKLKVTKVEYADGEKKVSTVAIEAPAGSAVVDPNATAAGNTATEAQAAQ